MNKHLNPRTDPGLASIVDLTLPDPLPSDFYDQQRAILLTGQLKAMAKPFYDHLRTHDAAWLDNAMTIGNLVVMEPGSNPPTPSPYPWSEAPGDDANRAPATLGQLKAVFSLPIGNLIIPPLPPRRTIDAQTPMATACSTRMRDLGVPLGFCGPPPGGDKRIRN
jgi:hypothetical protein